MAVLWRVGQPPEPVFMIFLTSKFIKMKKIIFILSIAATVAVIFHSCKKEKSINNLKGEPTEASYSQQIMERIIGFGDKMNSSMKSGGSMHIDTAVWDLEALISYENAYPDSSSRDFITVESFYTLHVDADSMATDAAVQAVYQLMLDTIDYHLSQIDASMKFLVFCDVELIEVVGNTAFVQATNGYGFNLILGWYTPFEVDDDWIWGDNMGSCNSSPLTELSDASDEMQYRLNHPAVQINTGADGYTDYETVEITYANCANTIGPWKIYYGSNYSYCIQDAELTTRLEGAHDLIYDYNDPSNDYGIWDLVIYEDEGEGARPADKDFISIEIVDETVVSSSYLYLHRYILTYAKPWYAPTN